MKKAVDMTQQNVECIIRYWEGRPHAGADGKVIIKDGKFTANNEVREMRIIDHNGAQIVLQAKAVREIIKAVQEINDTVVTGEEHELYD